MNFLSRLDALIKASISSALKHTRGIQILAVFTLITGGILASQLERTVSIEDQLDPNLESTRDLKHAKELTGHQSTLGFIITHPTQNDLCIVSSLIPKLAIEHPEIEDSSDPLKARQAVQDGGKLYYPAVYSDPCLKNPTEAFDGSPLQSSPWGSLIVSNQNDDFLVSLSMQFEAKLVKNVMNEVESAFSHPVMWTGTVSHDFYTNEGMDQSLIQNLLILAVILISFRIAFGTFKSFFIYAGTMSLTAAGVYGGMKIFGHKVDGLSICLFLMLTFSALEDFVFLSYAQMGYRPTDDEPTPFHRLALPCLFTSITTAVAFASLSISDLTSIRHFGLWAAFGSILEWASVFYVLPSFTTRFKFAKTWTNPSKSYFRNLSAKFIHYTPPRFLARASLLLIVFGAYSVHNSKITQSPTEMFPDSHPFTKTVTYIKASRGWAADAHLFFEIEVPEAKRIQIVKTLGEDAAVSKSIRWNQIEAFVSAKIDSPLMREMIGREVRSVKMSSNFWAKTGEEQVDFFLRTSDTSELERLREKTRALCPAKECWLTGEFVAYADYSKQLLGTLFESLALSLILVALVILYLSYAKNELKNYWKIALSSFWGPAVLLGCVHLFGVTMNFVTCIVASTLVGLTGDNAVQFLLAKKGDSLKHGIGDRAHSAIQCSVMMACCALTFSISYFAPARTLGYMLSGGFLFALIGDLWVLQGLLKDKSEPRTK